MGIPKPKNELLNKNKGGACFQPNRFKGNIELFTHLNESSLNKMNQTIDISNSVKV